MTGYVAPASDKFAVEVSRLTVPDADRLTTFDGSVPEGTFFSLAYEYHAASWLRHGYFIDPNVIMGLFDASALATKRPDKSWGPLFRVKPEPISMQRFPHLCWGELADGLIFHFGLDVDVPGEEVALEHLESVFGDGIVQGQLKQMRVRWVLIKDGVLDLTPVEVQARKGFNLERFTVTT